MESARSTPDTTLGISADRCRKRPPLCCAFPGSLLPRRRRLILRYADARRGRLNVNSLEALQEGNESRGIVGGEHAADLQVSQCGSGDFDRLLSVAIEFARHALQRLGF